ncbi:MAG TPA: hypothetical protein PK760_11060 [Flavobacteriales bacterium]|nr:hypothetical protein [Flavobacteriales bacterium]
MTDKIVLTYAVYLPLVIALTLYVARTLFRNGRVFMLDIFKGKADIADATNKLFETGFYLMNLGFALLIMRVDQGYLENVTNENGVITGRAWTHALDTNQEVVETLAHKLGGFAIYLGIMLFLNLYLFFRGRRKSRMTPPNMPGTIGGPVVTPQTH